MCYAKWLICRWIAFTFPAYYGSCLSSTFIVYRSGCDVQCGDSTVCVVVFFYPHLYLFFFLSTSFSLFRNQLLVNISKININNRHNGNRKMAIMHTQHQQNAQLEFRNEFATVSICQPMPNVCLSSVRLLRRRYHRTHSTHLQCIGTEGTYLCSFTVETLTNKKQTHTHTYPLSSVSNHRIELRKKRDLDERNAIKIGTNR